MIFDQQISASVVLPDRDTILLVRLAGDQGGWNLPTATVASGEAIQQSARRAVLEATGVAVALTNLVGIYSAVLANAPTSVALCVQRLHHARLGFALARRSPRLHGCHWTKSHGLADDQLADAPLLRRIVADRAAAACAFHWQFWPSQVTRLICCNLMPISARILC